jgi:hypothetical protein
MQPRPAQVGTARRFIAHRVSQSFELPTAHLFQVRPIRAGRRCLIKEDWHTESSPDLQPSLPGKQGALLQLDPSHWHKWHHVRGANARMNTLLAREIDQVNGPTYSADRGLNHRGWLPGNRHDRAVMVGIH